MPIAKRQPALAARATVPDAAQRHVSLHRFATRAGQPTAPPQSLRFTVITALFRSQLRGFNVLVPMRGLLNVKALTSAQCARSLPAGCGLFLPQSEGLEICPDTRTGSVGLLFTLDAPQTRFVRQELGEYRMVFPTFSLVRAHFLNQWPTPLQGANAASQSAAVLDSLAAAYAYNRRIIARLPGGRERQEDLYRRLLAAVEQLESHHDPHLGRVTRHAHFSKSHFYQIFRIAFGVTPGRYLIALRMARAMNYLIWSTLPVEDISALSGYSERCAFSRAFAAFTGASPARYREDLPPQEKSRLARFFCPPPELRQINAYPLAPPL